MSKMKGDKLLCGELSLFQSSSVIYCPQMTLNGVSIRCKIYR